MSFFDDILSFFGLTKISNVSVDDSNSDTKKLEHIPGHSKELVFNDEDYWWYCPPKLEPQFPVFEGLNNPSVFKELVKKISNGSFSLLEIPDNIVKIVQLMNNANFDYIEVSHLINKSPMMAGDFLKVINSVAYSRGVKINDLSLALPRIGQSNIKGMLYVYSSKNNIVGNSVLSNLLQQIVKHSNVVAIIARYLAQRYFPDPDIAFLSGLLHDIGKIALLKEFSVNYDLSDMDGLTHITEDSFSEIFPPLHARIGKYVTKNWDIDETVVAAIEHHHDYLEVGFSSETQIIPYLSALIELSDTMALLLGHGKFIDDISLFELPSIKYMDIVCDSETVEYFKAIETIEF